MTSVSVHSLSPSANFEVFCHAVVSFLDALSGTRVIRGSCRSAEVSLHWIVPICVKSVFNGFFWKLYSVVFLESSSHATLPCTSYVYMCQDFSSRLSTRHQGSAGVATRPATLFHEQNQGIATCVHVKSDARSGTLYSCRTDNDLFFELTEYLMRDVNKRGVCGTIMHT